MKLTFTIIGIIFSSLFVTAQIIFPFNEDLVTDSEVFELAGKSNSSDDGNRNWNNSTACLIDSLGNYKIINCNLKTLDIDSIMVKTKEPKFLLNWIFDIAFGSQENFTMWNNIERKNENLTFHLSENNEIISFIEALRLSNLKQRKSIQLSIGTISDLVVDTSYISAVIQIKELAQLIKSELIIITDEFSPQNKLVSGRIIHGVDSFSISSIQLKKKKRKNCEGISIKKGNKTVAGIQISGISGFGDTRLKIHSLVDKHSSDENKTIFYSLITLIAYYYLEK